MTNRLTTKQHLLLGTVLAGVGVMAPTAAWADCVAGVPSTQITCSTGGTNGFNSATAGLTINVQSTALVNTAPTMGAPLLSAGANSSVNNSGVINAGSADNPGITLGGNSTLNNNSTGQLTSAIDIGAGGAGTSTINNQGSIFSALTMSDASNVINNATGGTIDHALAMLGATDTITNDGDMRTGVLMHGTAANTYNAGSLGSAGDNGLRLPGQGGGVLSGLTQTSANNVLNLNGTGASALQAGASILNFGVVNKNDGGAWLLQTTLDGNPGKLTSVNVTGGSLNINSAAFLGSSATTVKLGNSTTVRFDGALTGTFAGNIADAAGVTTPGLVIVTGANPTTLSGTNSYSGATSIVGGNLVTGSNGALSSNSDFFLQSGGRLNVNNAVAVKTLNDGGTGPNTVNLTGGATSLALTGGTWGASGGTVTGTGTLIKSGAGTFTLAGANAVNLGGVGAAGTFAVNNGTVAVTAANAIGASTNVQVNSSATGAGTLTFAGVDTIGSLSGTGSGAVVSLGNGVQLTTGGNNNLSTVYEGVISGGGSLIKAGGGALTLTGANSYSGGTTVNNGELDGFAGTGGASSLQGNIVANSIVVFDQTLGGPRSGTYAGNLSGTGQLIFDGVNGAGGTVLTLSGNNTVLTGSMSFVTGTVAISSANNVGVGQLGFFGGTLETTATLTLNNVVVLANGGTFQTDAGTTTLSGVIGGPDGFTKSGAGTLTLSGANVFTGVTTVSAGTLDLKGGAAIADTGAVVVNGGTLQVDTAETIGSLAGTGGSVLLNAGLTTGGNNANTTYAGVIAGTNGLTKVGTGTFTLTGANTYTGGTTVNAGELMGFGGTGGSLQGNIAVGNSGILFFDQTLTGGHSGTYAGNVSGAGQATFGGVNGAGGTVLTLSGNNAGLAGAMNFVSGTVGIGSATNVGTGALNFGGGGTLETTASLTLANAISLNAGGGNFNTDSNTIAMLSGVVSGPGALTKTGAGTLTLSGANTYTGGTTVSAGTLIGTTTSLKGNIAVSANGILSFQQNANGTYAGSLSGAGEAQFLGMGGAVLTLTGDNTGLTGPMSFDGGTVAIGSATNVGTGLLNFQGGTLETTASLTLTNSVGLATGKVGTFQTDAATTLSGVIFGPGALTKTGTAQLTLSGANTFAGPATVTAGTLQLKGGNAIADGTAVVVTGGTLEVDNAETIGSLAGTGGAVDLNALLTAGGNNTSTTYAGAITGASGLTKAGTGTMTLSGANTFTGAATVTAGTLDLTGGAAIADTGAVIVNGGTLKVDNAETIGSLAGTGGSVLLNAGLTTGGDNSNTTYAGVISGAGGLTKNGTGTLTITGANTYSGGTTVNGGILLGSTTSLQGNIVVNNAGNVVFSQALGGAHSGTYAGNLSGTGQVLFNGVNGAGGTVLTLSGNNSSMTGMMVFASGTTAIGNANNVGGQLILDGGALETTAAMTLNNVISMLASSTLQTDAATTLSGAITGAGMLTKTGTANLTLSGANTYSGGTIVLAGTLTGTTTSLVGNIADNAAVVFDQTTAGTYAGNLSGTGTVTKNNTGTVTFAGNNSYSGATAINGGTLIVGPNGIGDSSAVTVASGATLQLAANETIGSLTGGGTLAGAGTLTTGGINNSTVFNGSITGAGINKVGTSTFTLNGSGNAAALTAGAGILALNGAFTAPASVASGATLNVLAAGKLTGAVAAAAGSTTIINGTVTGTVINAGALSGSGTINGGLTNSGTLSPGNSPGIFTVVNGPFTQTSTGTLTMELTPNATAGIGYDQLLVTGAPGTAVLGGTLAIQAQVSSAYVTGTTYDIIDAAGGITGSFATITGAQPSPFLKFNTGIVTIAGTEQVYRLTVARTSYALGLGASATPNQIAVANGFQILVVSPTGDAATLVNSVDHMTARQGQSFFDQASPESYGAYANALYNQSELFTRQVAQQMHDTPKASGLSTWGHSYGEWGQRQNRLFRFGSNQDIYGGAMGVDYRNDGLTVGVAGGYSHDKVNYGLGNSHGHENSWQVGAYADYADGPVDFDLQLAHEQGTVHATKTIKVSGIAGVPDVARGATATPNGHVFRAIGTVGYTASFSGNISARPFVGVDWSNGNLNGFTETGAGAADLTVGDIRIRRTDAVVGIDVGSNTTLGLVPYARLAYKYDLRGRSNNVSAYFNGNQATAFTVSAVRAGRSEFAADAGLSYGVNRDLTIFAGYEGTYRIDVQSNGVSAGLRLNFGGHAAPLPPPAAPKH